MFLFIKINFAHCYISLCPRKGKKNTNLSGKRELLERSKNYFLIITGYNNTKNYICSKQTLYFFFKKQKQSNTSHS